jgi:hypothetical protein
LRGLVQGVVNGNRPLSLPGRLTEDFTVASRPLLPMVALGWMSIWAFLKRVMVVE